MLSFEILPKNVCELVDAYGGIGATTRTHRDSSASFDIVALNPFRFSSEYYDSELDLVYYNYRHYSPSLGRFLSRDPIEEQGGLNLYAFVGNEISIDLLGTKGKSGRIRPQPIYPGGVGRPLKDPVEKAPPFSLAFVDVFQDVLFGDFVHEVEKLRAMLIMRDLAVNGEKYCLASTKPDSKSLRCGGCCVVSIYLIREAPSRFGFWTGEYIAGRGDISAIVSYSFSFHSTPCGATHFIFAPTPPLDLLFLRFPIKPKK